MEPSSRGAGSSAGGERPVVLNSMPVPVDYLEPLQGVAEILQPPGPSPSAMTREEILETGRARGIAGLIIPGDVPVDAAFLDALPSLRIVANTAVGYDNLPLELLRERGVSATNAPESFVHATADAALALLLAVARKIPRADAFVRSGRWPESSLGAAVWEGWELRGKTLGILGYGRIGAEVGRRAEAFGMEVIYHRRRADGDPRWRDLEGLLSEADVVTLHTPLTPETRHLLNRERLAEMKPGAILLNLARGPVIDEAALVEALDSGHLAGAGLDVFEEEPVVHPGLLELENVVLTPHLGGATWEGRRHARLLAAENVARVLCGQRPLTPLNEVGP